MMKLILVALTIILISFQNAVALETVTEEAQPLTKEFTIDKSKLVVQLTEKKIRLVSLSSTKTKDFKGPSFGPKDRWVFAHLKVLGKQTFLELKVATFPEGTSNIQSAVWWIVYELKGNRLVRKASFGIHELTQEEFYTAEETLSRTKTEIKSTGNGRIQFMLDDEELKP